MKKISSRLMVVWFSLCASIGFAVVGFTVSNDLVNWYIAEESTPMPTDIAKDCLLHNSYSWLNSRRVSNGGLIPHDYVVNMTAKFRPFSSFSELAPYLRQSLADSRSSFLNTSFPGALSDVSSRRIHQWAVKLVFIAIQYHQHRPARQEAELRYQDPSNKQCRLQMENYSVGNFDYECIDSKFIVGGLTANGLGSNVRAAISTLIVCGLVTNRTVVLVQNGEDGPQFIRKAWKLSSCMRKDFQCVYYPITPCIPTWEMVKNAYVLDKNRPYNYYFDDGRVRNIPENEVENRVWVLQKYGVTEVPPRAAVDLLIQCIRELFEHIRLETGQRSSFRKVLQYISDSANPRSKRISSSFSYPAAANVVNHAAEVFALRPNFQNRITLDEIMKEITPSANEPSSLIGLPIRASDKCHRESECLTFAGHMTAVNLAKQKLPMTNDTSGHTILFTSESVEMTNEQKAYSMTASDRFLVNFRDVTPGSGLISEVLKTERFTADESMISALSTLSFQMKAMVSILNCCSNFHMLLKDLLLAGLGYFGDDANPVCLQDFDEPALKLCCAWEMADCQARKRNFLP